MVEVLARLVAKGDECPALFVGVYAEGEDGEAVGHLEGDSGEVVGREVR